MTTTRDPVFGCELSDRVARNGYAYGKRGGNAHVERWVEAFGPVPSDRVLDHICRRRACSALHHLELVTKRENELRKAWSYRAAMKQCAKGHLMQGALVTPEMGRLCRTCHQNALGRIDARGAG